MSACGDEQLDYLELFHFAVCIIEEDVNFLGMFKSGLAKLLRSRVSRCLSELSEPLTETKFVNSPAYQKLVASVSAQLHSIVADIRQEKCWFAQGSGSAGDPVDSLSKVLSCSNYGIDELRVLRRISIDKLTFMPELTLYYEALFRATMSDNKFVRCFSYAMIREAPPIFDSRHFFTILNEVLKIWTGSQVTFEFAAALALVLNALCDVIGTVLEDELQELLYQLIESVPKSPNFSILTVFDPTLRWITKSLPIESLRRVLNFSLEQLREHSWGHICLVCRAVTRGIIGFELLTQALEISVPFINEWPMPVKRETRVVLASLVSRLPDTVVIEILRLMATVLKDETNESSVLFVFSEFVIINYLETTAPFEDSLFQTLSEIILRGSRSKDIDSMFAAICGNPVRFLSAVQKAKDAKVFQSIQTYHQLHTSLYHVLFAPSESPLLSSDHLKLLINSFLEKSVLGDEICEMDQGLEHLALGLNACLYPSALDDLIEAVDQSFDEDLKRKIIGVVHVIALTGREREWLKGIRSKLPNVTYICEYSQMLKEIDEFVRSELTSFEVIRSKLPPAVHDATVIGSRLLIRLAILFQITLCYEAKSMCVAFLRSRISSPEWFTFVCSSLFVTIWKDPVPAAESMREYVKESPYYLVWFALRAAMKVTCAWADAIADERFEDLFRLVLCPQIEGCFDSEDIAMAKMLHEKYRDVIVEIEAIIATSVA